MVVVVLLAVRAMERCLFVLWLLSFLCFDRFISLQVVCGSDFVRVLRPSFEFRSTWLRGSSYDTTPLCCSLSASVSVDSSSGGVGPPRSERGLHALARVGNVPLFRPSGWCFSGWSAGWWRQGRPECGGWSFTRWSGWFLLLAWRFCLCVFLYIPAFFHSLLL